MRRIELPEIIEKRKRRNRLIVGIILIALMVLSTAGYALLSGSSGSPEEEQTSNGELVYNGQYWLAEKGGKQLAFSSSLEEVQGVPVSIRLSAESYSGSSVYIDSADSYSLNELGNNLYGIAGRVQEACYGNCNKNLPEKNCTEHLIVVRPAEKESVYQQDNCVFIDGGIVAVDAFLYRIFGFTKQ